MEKILSLRLSGSGQAGWTGRYGTAAALQDRCEPRDWAGDAKEDDGS